MLLVLAGAADNLRAIDVFAWSVQIQSRPVYSDNGSVRFVLKQKLMRKLLVAALLAITSVAQAQEKIGYVHLELILLYMPESKQMDQTLATFQKKLQEQLEVKQQYYQSRLDDYTQKKEKGEPVEALEQELLALGKEIEELITESEERVFIKRQELLEPILEKLQEAIEKVREQGGYAMILNATDGEGVSIVVSAPEELDLTETVLEELGVETDW